MKGIILAGGSGTRLFPMTQVVSKQLLPVYDKPMIYYPLSVLMLSNIRDILVISTPQDLPRFHELLGDGSRWGINLSYIEQTRPEGLAHAFILGRQFVGNDSVCLILGDNIFFGQGLRQAMQRAMARDQGATIFAYLVRDPQRYGIVKFDENGLATNIEEKPAVPKSNWAVTGLYYYDNQVLDIAAKLKPSARGELEITDVNNAYLAQGQLNVEKMGRGMAWLDTGTPGSLLKAANFIGALESRQSLKVACPEEVAYNMGFIDAAQVERLARPLMQNSYGQYLLQIIKPEYQ